MNAPDPQARRPGRALAWLVLLVVGCSTPPPPPPGLAPAAGSAAQDGSQFLSVILPPEHTPVLDAWEQSAMITGGDQHAIVHVVRPGAGDPPSRQAELVREEVQNGATAVLVVAHDPKSIAPALDEARSSGISVVLLQRPVPSSGAPFTLVTFPPLADSAREMVDAMIAALKRDGRPEGGAAAVVFLKSSDDPESPERRAGIRSALASAGVAKVTEFEFENDPEQYRGLYDKILALEPRPTMIFADEDVGLSAMARSRFSTGRLAQAPLVGGLMYQKKNNDLIEYNQVASAVDLNVTGLSARGVIVALDQARGQKFPAKVVFPRPVRVASNPGKPVGVIPPTKTKGNVDLPKN